MRQFVISIGYVEYTVPAHHIGALMEILGDLHAVKQVGYEGPYYLNEDAGPSFEGVKLAEVSLGPAPEEKPVPAFLAKAEAPDEMPF